MLLLLLLLLVLVVAVVVVVVVVVVVAVRVPPAVAAALVGLPTMDGSRGIARSARWLVIRQQLRSKGCWASQDSLRASAWFLSGRESPRVK